MSVAADIDRHAVLEREVCNLSSHGWTVVAMTDTQATLEKGKHTNHVLHLLLSLITVGLWVPVWIAVAVFGGRKTRLVTVDPYGRIV